MFSLGSSHRFYLYSEHCDLRKSFDGLCGLVSSGLQRSPTNGEVFVFLNRSRTHIKLLHWESGGFVLLGGLSDPAGIITLDPRKKNIGAYGWQSFHSGFS